jgi:probable HAF family extracellular repeat protein
MRALLCVATALLLETSHTLAAATLYQVTDLGISAGLGLNNIGEVTGWNEGSFNTYAVLYSNGHITNLGTLGGLNSYGRAINNNGQVTGLSDTGSGTAQHAFLYGTGGMINAGSLTGSPNSFSTGNGTNDDGQVTGVSETSAGFMHAFLYSNGQMMDLGTLPGRDNIIGSGINNHGQVAGYSFNTASDPHAFVFSHGQFMDLGTLGGSWSEAYAINDAGQVTGTAQTPAGEPASVGHAFLYSNGQMTDLGTLGGLYSLGFGINNSGQIVGQAATSDGVLDAFLYSGGKMSDLNDLVDLSGTGFGKLYGATAINDSGQILAGACATPSNCDGLGHTVLLTPVPEPATPTLTGLALLVLAANVGFSGSLTGRRKPGR